MWAVNCRLHLLLLRVFSTSPLRLQVKFFQAVPAYIPPFTEFLQFTVEITGFALDSNYIAGLKTNRMEW